MTWEDQYLEWNSISVVPVIRETDTAQALREIHATGISLPDAARKLGWKYHSTRTLALKMGFKFAPPRKPAGAREIDMKARYEAGETLEQIGVRYNITRERVRQLLSKHFKFNWENGGLHICAKVNLAFRVRERDRRYIKKWGHDFATHKSILSIGNRANPTNPIYAYIQQRRTARDRGVEWKFIFADWWAFWQESGKWPERGRHGDAYVMTRIGDSGPYSRENCIIKTLRENSAEGQITKKRRRAENLAVAA